MIFTINKTENSVRPTIEYNLIPKMNIAFIFQIIAVLSSWALHESIIRSIFAYIFGFIYLLCWAIFGDSATKEGMEFIIEYYKSMF